MQRNDKKTFFGRRWFFTIILSTVVLLILGVVVSFINSQTIKTAKPTLSILNLSVPTGGVDLIANQHWQMAGETVQAASQHSPTMLKITSTNLSIVNQDGTFGQGNSPLNLYGTSLHVSGNFSVSAKLSGVSNEIGISLYGTPPLIEDELRAEEGTLDIDLSGNLLRVNLSDQANGLGAATENIQILPDVNPTIKITDRSGVLTFIFNNRVVGKPINDQGIFKSGTIWLGIDARTPGSTFTVNNLTSSGLDGGIVKAVDARNQQILPAQTGFAALAQKQRKGFLIGAAVALGPMVSDSIYQGLLGNFNAVSTENAGKFQTIHPLPGNQPQDYNFSEMDGIVSIALKAGMQVHGHALIFGEANPLWVQEIATKNPSQLQQVMVDHITNVVSHYKGRVASWDVINEPLADYNTQPGQNGLRKDIWYNAIGPDYIAIALRAAHQADPNAQLWINDFGMETDNQRFTTMLDLVKRLQSQGVPLTGIGFQAHIDSGDTINNDTHIDTSQLKSHIELLGQLGIKVRISELDITNESEYPVYSDIIGSCIQEPNCVGVTMWGITDKYSSSGDLSNNGIYTSGIGLPWDLNLQPLPAVDAIKSILQ